MFPRGDTPEKVREFYLYLQGHQEGTHRVDSWHVDWMSLAWLWGFVISLVVILLLWVRQYRTTKQPSIYPLDDFGGWTTEAAGPAATMFFVVLVTLVVAFAVVLIVGHIVYGQKF